MDLTSLTLESDNDENAQLDCVTAAAKLRAEVYGLEPKSIFFVKETAGNIIAALATIDAVVAFINVTAATKGLQRQQQQQQPPRVWRAAGTDIMLAALSIKPRCTMEVLSDLAKTHVRVWAGFGGPCCLSATKAERRLQQHRSTY
ncbi:hypothetical protein HDU88_001550 [Geranomyces variabilis]|nr:hypothetical protein HDU88_001550 [Geranomyces variabilis]